MEKRVFSDYAREHHETMERQRIEALRRREQLAREQAERERDPEYIARMRLHEERVQEFIDIMHRNEVPSITAERSEAPGWIAARAEHYIGADSPIELWGDGCTPGIFIAETGRAYTYTGNESQLWLETNDPHDKALLADDHRMERVARRLIDHKYI